MPSTAKKKHEEMPALTAEQWVKGRRRARRADRRLELPLEGVRKAFAKTQIELADASGIDQPYISKLENADDLSEVKLGTLRRYVAACGGTLELVITGETGARIFLRDERVVTSPEKPRRRK